MFVVRVKQVMDWVTLLALLAVTLTGNAEDTSSTCREPDDILELMTLVDVNPYHWSYLNSPTSREEALENLEVYTEGGYRYSGPVEGIRTRRKARLLLKKNGGNLCPAIYKNQYDGNRIPATIKQAECLCEKCLLLGRKGRKKFRCEKLLAYTPVYRRNGCKDGVWSYKLVFEPVVVACSCNLKIPP